MNNKHLQATPRIICMTIAFVLFFAFSMTVFATPTFPLTGAGQSGGEQSDNLQSYDAQVHAVQSHDAQSDAIQAYINTARSVSRAPGVSVALTTGGVTRFYYSGVTDRESSAHPDDGTLWELASVSKAFTALGLIYLEKQGKISLADSISVYLPWLTFSYKGQPVDMQRVTLYDLLHHTSGITNAKHPNLVLDRPKPDTLLKTVESLIGAELTFPPGERMEYGTKNYDVLGLVIEALSGQNYGDFMEEQIFRPLGLTQTFAIRSHAEATGNMTAGYKSNFIFFTNRNDSPEAAGSVPCGYIITSPHDMARWMDIQTGVADGVPEIFRTIIPETHEPMQNAVRADGSYYAAGWEVSEGEKTGISGEVSESGKIVEHGGGNPGYSTYVLLFPDEKVGITVLCNISSVNARLIANDVKKILDGNLTPKYGVPQVNDILFTAGTVICLVLSVLFIFSGVRRFRKSGKTHVTKRAIILIASLAAVSGFMCVVLSNPALVFGVSWSFILTWMPYSLPSGLIALTLLSFCSTWFAVASSIKKR